MAWAKRMQHFAVEVSDTDASVAFYRRALGFKLTERHAAHEVGGIPVELTFMRLGDVHHELVLVHNPAKSYRPRVAPFEAELEGLLRFIISHWNATAAKTGSSCWRM